MKEFDYKRAWEELARPAFESLPANVRDLYERVCVEMAEARQNSSLGLDWPDNSGAWPEKLKVAFAHVPAEVLFDAQATIYNYGHWGSKRESHKGGGGTWKFQILAKQSLIARDWRSGEATWDTPRFSREVIERYMVETDLKVIARDARRAAAMVRYRAVIVAPYEAARIDTIARPHPFCITGRHMAAAQKYGGILGESAMASAPCGMRDCNLSYGEHANDETLFIRVPGRLGRAVPEDLAAMLMEAKAISAESMVVNFAFLEEGR